MNKSAWLITAIAVAATLLWACSPGPKSASGFRLPDGDPVKGEQAYAALRCDACHQLVGGDLPYTGSGQAVYLGGQVSRVDSYGTLVTSIINPSHKIESRLDYVPDAVTEAGESRMESARLNDLITVQQLIDLVAFLQSQYEVMPPPDSQYDYIYP